MITVKGLVGWFGGRSNAASKNPGGVMKKKLAVVGRILVLACGLSLAALSLVVMATAGEMAVRVTAAAVFAAGVIIVLLMLLVERLAIFSTMHRHLQYLAQNSQYTAGLLREITEVMRAIQEMEEQGQKAKPVRKKSQSYEDELTKEELALESTVRQFES